MVGKDSSWETERQSARGAPVDGADATSEPRSAPTENEK